MEQEVFFSGYCRQIDGSRTVCAYVVDGELEEADCCYESCVYAPNCPIAAQITEQLQ